MFQVAEGIKGVHILGVVQSKDALEDLLKICPINPQSRYVLIEVGMQKETVQDVLTGLGIVGTMAGAQYLHDAITFALEDHELIERITKLLYPQIAKVHNTTPSRIERAIRVAIERSWSLASIEYKKRICVLSLSLCINEFARIVISSFSPSVSARGSAGSTVGKLPSRSL